MVVPYVGEIDRLATMLAAQGVKVMKQGGDIDFAAKWPLITTYHSAKGLTFDAVFLPSLTATRLATYDDLGPRLRANLTYTALTRATRWAWIGVRDEDHVVELSPEVLDRLALSGRVSVVRCGAAPGRDEPAQALVDQTAGPGSDAGVLAGIFHL